MNVLIHTCDHRYNIVAACGLGIENTGDSALTEHDDPVDEIEDLTQIVGYDDHWNATFL
jgi:hypothetical protein